MNQEETSDDQLAILQQVHESGILDGPPRASPLQTESAEPDFRQQSLRDATPSLSQPEATVHDAHAYVSQARAPAMAPQLSSAQQSVHDFYHHLFSADLKLSRERAHFELQMHGDWQFNHAQEMNALLAENEALKSYNRRYLKMIKEVRESMHGAGGAFADTTPRQVRAASEVRRSAERRDPAKSLARLDLNAIG